MSDNHQVTWAVLAGAAIGGLIGFLFFTERGRRARARIEPAIDDLMAQAHGWRGAIDRVSALAAESGLLAGVAPEVGAAQGGERGPKPH